MRRFEFQKIKLNCLYPLILFCTNIACASRNDDLITASISSFSNGDISVKNDDELCFPRSKYSNPNASLSESAERDDIVSACESSAIQKGVKVRELDSTNPKCLFAMLNWAADSGTTYRGSARTTCNKVFETTICNTHQNAVTIYTKVLQISIFKMIDSKMKRAHEIKASLSSTNPAFNIFTAKALCRAAFHDYPSEVRDKTYSIDLTTTGKTE